jgi:hypothetical protein
MTCPGRTILIPVLTAFPKGRKCRFQLTSSRFSYIVITNYRKQKNISLGRGGMPARLCQGATKHSDGQPYSLHALHARNGTFYGEQILQAQNH